MPLPTTSRWANRQKCAPFSLLWAGAWEVQPDSANSKFCRQGSRYYIWCRSCLFPEAMANIHERFNFIVHHNRTYFKKLLFSTCLHTASRADDLISSAAFCLIERTIRAHQEAFGCVAATIFAHPKAGSDQQIVDKFSPFQ